MQTELKKVLDGIRDSKKESNAYNIELTMVSKNNTELNITYSPEIQSIYSDHSELHRELHG